MKVFASLLFLSCLVILAASDCPDTSGATRWSSLYSSLAAGAKVNIAAGSSVLLDVSTVVLDSVTISGTLFVEDTTLELKAGYVKVMNGGALIAGGSDCPITQKVTITLYGSSTNSGVNTIGTETDNGVTTQFGSKGLVVTTGGTIVMYGAVNGPTWTRISSSVEKGSSTLNLKEAVQWKAGDTVIITSTDYAQVYNYDKYSNFPESIGAEFPDQNEKKQIQSVSSDGMTIVLTTPLNFGHWGKDYQFAEVAVLDRNIVIQSDPGSEADNNYGGHIMMRKGKRIELSGIEVTRMGQKGVLARYPVHFHNMRFAFDIKPFIKDSSIHDNFQRCLVIHESHGVTVSNNVAFNTFGHCFFLEDGGEHGNVFDSNLGVYTQPTVAGTGQLIPSDDRPAIFWITNPNNTWTNNVAVGGHFGFWFGMPVKPRNLGKIYWDNDPFMFPRQLPLGLFDSNVAHSNFQNGVHIDDMETSNGETELADYRPMEGPYTDYYPYGVRPLEARFTRTLAYKNRDFGIWGKTGLHFDECVLQDNAKGFMVNGRTVLSNSLITGESDNVGNPVSIYGRPVESRSYPSRWGDINQDLQGHSSYDNGGPQFSVRNTFVNFVSTPDRKAGALVPIFHGPFMLYPRNQFGHELSFINANRVYINYGPADCEYGWNILDADGSVTGINGGAWIQSNETHFQRDGCNWKEEWNAYVCPLFAEGYIQFSLTSDSAPSAAGGAGTGYDIPKTGGRTIRSIVRPLGSDYYTGVKGQMQGASLSGFQYMHNLIARRSYSLEFYTDDGTPSYTPSSFTINMQSSSPGDWIIFALPYPSGTTFSGKQLNYPYGDLSEVDSVSKLTPTTFYYDSDTNHLYLLFVNNDVGAQVSDVFGYGVSDAGYYAPLQIQASCGGGCQPTLKGVPPIPTLPSALNAESYIADLQGCQSIVTPSSSNSGKAFFFFHPESFSGNRELHYKFFHDLKGTGLSISILDGAIGAEGKSLVTQSIATGTTASAGIWYLSRNQWEKLVAGNLYASIMDSDGKEVLRGQIQCSGSCSKPSKSAASLYDVCKPSYETLPVYTDNLISPISTSAWDTSSITVDPSYTADVLCGSSALRFGFQAKNNALLFSYWGSQKDLVLDSRFKSLEFFVKVAPGYGSIPLSVGCYTESGEQSMVNVKGDEIDNYVIDETVWSRVRISVSRLELDTFSGKLKNLIITYNRYPYVAGDVIIDEVRWITEEAQAITEQSDVSVATAGSPICSGRPSIVGAKDTNQNAQSSATFAVPFLLVPLIAVLFI
eukprot:TRINITY_DN657_c0_g1_i1.p1 TRINITY_DN657_c0_g1~~TRINITY_DN657_c0_g1_i1.p1  ORF type:complete len:1272 (+),score=378.16 TRINITY_DN657_c0_g1_i1:136-3951(+)